MSVRLLAGFSIARWTFLVVGIALALSMLPVADAIAQIDKNEANCINSLNKGGRLVTKQVAKQIQTCIKDYAKNKSTDADACKTTDPKGKIGKMKDKTDLFYDKKCLQKDPPAGPPSFGPQDPNQVNAAAVAKEQELYAAVFGPDLDLLTRENKADKLQSNESKCIQAISKSIAKCQDAKLLVFLKCKKDGIKAGTITDNQELQDECLGTGSNQQPDPKDLIFKKCKDTAKGAIYKDMQKKCVDKEVDLVSAFGNGNCADAAALGGTQLADCIEAQVECAVCAWANATDGLSRDCDVFAGISCGGEPAFCGNGVLDPNTTEACDASDDAACPGECRYDCACPPPSCGNGVMDPNTIEECDGTDDAACNAGPCLSDCTCECDCCGTENDLLSFTTTLASGNAGVLRRFLCSNDSNAACADDSDCDFGSCFLGANLCDVGYTVPCDSDADCVGTCYEQVAGTLPRNLERGGLYTGAGLNSVPLPLPIPDKGQNFSRVIVCDPSSGELTLGATGADEVGERHCTSGRKCSTSGTTCVLDADCPPSETCDTECLFGPPLPIPNPGTPATSVCAINHVAEDGFGTGSCRGGETELTLGLRSVVYLTGDMFSSSTPPDIPGVQPCPLCDRLCQGGSKDQFPCTDASDCPGGSCGSSTECLGGVNDGGACTPETSGSDLLGDPNAPMYPTSQDCLIDPLQDITANIGGLPVALSLTTGSITVNAVDRPTGRRNFFGFCRDVSSQGAGGGSLCFEGNNIKTGCPPANPAATGNAVLCDSDADCDDGDEYESCLQRNSGAFSYATASQIEVTGDTDGQCLADLQPHSSTLVSVFAIPPTFDATVDAAGDLPGPGAALLGGEAQLQ